MGMTSDEEGETSAKTYRSDDSNDRPLKKARYVWQIKGKYHLKKPENEEGAKLIISEESRDGYALHQMEMSHCEATSQSLEAGTAASSTNMEVSNPEPTVVTPLAAEVKSPVESEDPNPWQLQKWQARQVARCFVDNTINRVLEDMGFIPLPVDTDDLMEDFTMSGLNRNNAHLEDAAVMMAIHSHGLQRAVAGVRPNSEDSQPADSCVCNFSVDNSMEQIKGWYVTDSQNSDSSDQRNEFITNGFIQEGLSLVSGWSQVDSSPKQECRSDQKGENESSQDVGCDSNNESDCKEMETTVQADEPMYSSKKSPVRSSSSCEHTDFLDKAVAVAIQKKGLSTLGGIEYKL